MTRTVVVPDAAMRALAQTDCVTLGRHCHVTPETLELFDVKYRRGAAFAYDYAMDPEDLAEILKNPEKVEIAAQGRPIEKIDQRVYFVNSSTKRTLLSGLVLIIVFSALAGGTTR